jgi:hypothetical protein
MLLPRLLSTQLDLLCIPALSHCCIPINTAPPAVPQYELAGQLLWSLWDPTASAVQASPLTWLYPVITS